MTIELQVKIDNLLETWHEVGRRVFEQRYDNLDYDSPSYAKTAKDRRKYVALDAGSSGAFLVDKQTGNVFTIKAYGVPNRRIGHIDELSGLQLYKWRGY